jgi:hypothetical protein
VTWSTPSPARRRQLRPGEPPIPAGKLAGVGLTNDELIRRYHAGEPLDQLAAAADMTLSGVQARLRRLNVPPRRKTAAAKPTAKQIEAALKHHQSINAAAKALDVTRTWLAAEAQRLGLRHSFDPPDDLLQRHHAGATQAQLAEHYHTAASTIGYWLQALGVPRPPRGRRPRDG